MLPNIGTLLNGALIPKLLHSPFASWFLINLDFLRPHIAHFDNTIALPLLLLEIFGSMFSVSFLHFKQYDLIFIFYKATTFLHVSLIILLHLNITYKILKITLLLNLIVLYVACN